jgi:hypothetical protein
MAWESLQILPKEREKHNFKHTLKLFNQLLFQLAVQMIGI